ncbi:MAG: HAD family hydrolase [Alphaproteobacteria bacterium]|nr:HAD family hydrolase [Alphaproteobacteria bacterium]
MARLDSSSIRPAAFLDRDGVVNHDIGYAHRPDQIVWIDGVFAAVRRLNDAGYHVFVVTNQAGIARGLYSEADVETLHAWMAEQLADAGARIDDWRYSPYHPEHQPDRWAHLRHWRKPAPGMLLDLMDRWPICRDGSFLIGDRDSDIEAARAAGIPGHRFEGGDLDRLVMGLLDTAGPGIPLSGQPLEGT